MTDDAEHLADELEELAVGFAAAKLEHVFNRWLRHEIALHEVLVAMGPLRTEFELLQLMLQDARLELSVRLSPTLSG